MACTRCPQTKPKDAMIMMGLGFRVRLHHNDTEKECHAREALAEKDWQARPTGHHNNARRTDSHGTEDVPAAFADGVRNHRFGRE